MTSYYCRCFWAIIATVRVVLTNVLLGQILPLILPGFLMDKVAEWNFQRNRYSQESPVLKYDVIRSYGSWRQLKFLVPIVIKSRMTHSVRVGSEIPNISLVKIDNEALMTSSCRLRDFCQTERPLVVCFGSCTWPPFVQQLGLFRDFVLQFQKKAVFIIVYIQEAHPSDEWNYDSNQFDIRRHRCLDDRVAAAGNLYKMDIPCPFLVDNMDDEASWVFDAVPERLYVVLNGRVAFQGGKGPAFFDLGIIRKWLEAHFDS